MAHGAGKFFSVVNGAWMLCDTVNDVWTLCDIVNGAMNALRYCQLRDDACRNVGTSAKLSSPFEKANTYAVYPYSMINFIPSLGMRFRIANSCTSSREILKGLSQDAGRADFT